MGLPFQRFFSLGAMVRAALIAAAYALLVVFFAPLSYGPVQVRIAEALTLLPWPWVEAIPGLFLGCLIANLFGGFGLIDVIFGSAATLVAAVLTRLMPNRFLAALPPVVVNALVVGGYLAYLTEVSFPFAAMYVGVGQAVACYALGLPLLAALEKRFPGDGFPSDCGGTSS
ncbi:MAG: QueT transporter family protein [Thermovirgaceae bacterium]